MTTSISIESRRAAAASETQTPLLDSRCASARKIRDVKPGGQMRLDQGGAIPLELVVCSMRARAAVIVVYANQLADICEPQLAIAVARDVESVIRPQPVARIEGARFEGAPRIEDRLLADVGEHDLVCAESSVVDPLPPRHVDVAIVDGALIGKHRRDIRQAADQHIVGAEKVDPSPLR